jgi:hypothetical protein
MVRPKKRKTARQAAALPAISQPPGLHQLANDLEGWLRVTKGRPDAFRRFSREQVRQIARGLSEAARWERIKPEYLEQKTRLARAREAMRYRKGRARIDAFAREMGVVTPGRKRVSWLARHEAHMIIDQYVSMTMTENALVTFADPTHYWASGLAAKAEQSDQIAVPIPSSILPPRPVVETPIPTVEALQVIADWHDWRFQGNPESVQRFLSEERHHLREERARLGRSRREEDRRLLSRLPADDFEIPSKTTVSKRTSLGP